MQTNQLRTPPRRSRTSSFAAKTERSCSKLHCGLWDLGATKSRQARGQLCTPRSLLNTPRAKRKISPQPSVNSSTVENETPYPMSSSRPNGRQPNNMYDPSDGDDDDVMDLHMNLHHYAAAIQYMHQYAAASHNLHQESTSVSCSSDEECDNFLPWLERKARTKISAVLSIGKSAYGSLIFLKSQPVQHP
ncbi:hypothetical protein LOK49_LG10G02812 [Camellia lanceoleosa]|uniref:Uncharacterized protein n=1 Tax=Camellia lanceoleosa TaxID=1840588 RepID=A0ACC0GF93_9ERIC|nr:hypothetical protein LOK49_LG10G02812 [Camellia lanceoleosa]